MAEERKRVLECQAIVESMVGSPLVIQELSKVWRHRDSIPCMQDSGDFLKRLKCLYEI